MEPSIKVPALDPPHSHFSSWLERVSVGSGGLSRSGTSGRKIQKMQKMVAKCFWGFAAHLVILLIVPMAIGSPVAEADADAEAEADPG